MKPTTTTKKKSIKTSNADKNPMSDSSSVHPEATSGASLTVAPVSGVAMQLQAIESACGYGDPLSDDERRAGFTTIRRTPASIVDRILSIAVRQKGVVAGIAFDPDAAKQALAEADEAEAIAIAADHLMRRAQDHAIRKRATVTGTAAAIRETMRGFAKTAQGQGLRSENDQIHSLARQAVAARKARKTKAENAVKSAASTPKSTQPTQPTEPSNGGSTPPTEPPPAPKAS
jgi:hypothetical protein